MKVCRRCGEQKPDRDFYSRGPARGRESQCKACSISSKTARYRARKAGLLPTEHVEVQVCGDCGLNRHRSEYGVDHARRTGLKLYCNPCTLVRWRQSRYRISQEQYEDLRVAQRDSCAICRRCLPLVIDHDHSTGKVRGLLCDACNVGLGRFEDCPDRMTAAAAYILRARDALKGV